MAFRLPFQSVTEFGQSEVSAAAVQQNFDALASAVTGFGGKSVEIRYGTVTLTWAAATGSALVTVTHGLGRTPVAITATLVSAGVGNRGYVVTGNIGATTFQMAGELTNGAATGSLVAHWVAIG